MSGLKEEIRKKILVDPHGDGGPWEDIKRLINYAVTIDATYTQDAKGRDNNKSHSDAPIAKINGNTGQLETKSLAILKAALPPFTRRVSRVVGRPLLQEILIKMMVFVFNVTLS